MKWTKMMLAAVCGVFIWLGLSTMTEAKAEGNYIHLEEFSADYKLQGLFATCSQTFQAGDWEVKDAELTLYYTATMLAREELSDLTVSINDRPVYSEKIPATHGETQVLRVSVPVDCIREGANQITIQSYIRTNQEDPCMDDVTEANWMMILKESQVEIRYTPAVSCADISDVYGQLTSIEATENKDSAVVLPGKPSNAELTAAALALSGMSGKAALAYENIAFVTTSDYSRLSDWKYVLYICSFDKCPAEIRAGMTEAQKEEARENAVMVWQKGDAGQDILAVVGDNDKALQNACRLLGNKENMDQTKTVWRAVHADEKVTLPYDPEKDNRLTAAGSYLSGPFKQTASFYVEQAANLKIAAGSRLTLRYRYSENLDFNRSLVTVFLGDTPIGSKKLTKDSANGDSLTVDIPDNLDVTGPFSLNVTFNLEIADMVCTMRQQDMPWAYITNESVIDLRTEEIPYLLFDYFPSPFVTNGRLNQVVVVLPQRESAADLEAFGNLMLTMGRYMKDNTGEIAVYRADDPGDLSEANVISIGAISVNPIAAQNNDRMYFQFNQEKTTLLSNEKMQIAPDYGAALGTAQLLYSPYAENDRGLLIISGVTEEGMSRAAAYLGSVENNWKLYGDGFAADKENVYCYRFGPDNAKEKALFEKLQSQTDLRWLIITGSCLMFLTVCAFILLMNKYQRKKRVKAGKKKKRK